MQQEQQDITDCSSKAHSEQSLATNQNRRDSEDIAAINDGRKSTLTTSQRGLLGTLTYFFSAIVDYRQYLIQSVARDLRRKYKRSSLGYLWSMLNPLFTMIVMTVVFSQLFPRIQHYSVFLFSALLGWQYFNMTVKSSTGAVLTNMKIVEQVPIPKFLFIISIACSGMVNFMLSLVPLVLVMLTVGRDIPLTVLWLPVAMIPVIILTLGVSMLVAVGTVFYDDVKHLSGVVLSGWYYLTPVLYGPELLPDHVAKWLQLNPLFFGIDNLRSIIYRGEAPDLYAFLYPLGIGIVLLFLALIVFEKADDKFVYFT